jgi:hypothetical protein
MPQLPLPVQPREGHTWDQYYGKPLAPKVGHTSALLSLAYCRATLLVYSVLFAPTDAIAYTWPGTGKTAACHGTLEGPLRSRAVHAAARPDPSRVGLARREDARRTGAVETACAAVPSCPSMRERCPGVFLRRVTAKYVPKSGATPP